MVRPVTKSNKQKAASARVAKLMRKVDATAKRVSALAKRESATTVVSRQRR